MESLIKIKNDNFKGAKNVLGKYEINSFSILALRNEKKLKQ